MSTTPRTLEHEQKEVLGKPPAPGPAADDETPNKNSLILEAPQTAVSLPSRVAAIRARSLLAPSVPSPCAAPALPQPQLFVMSGSTNSRPIYIACDGGATANGRTGARASYAFVVCGADETPSADCVVSGLVPCSGDLPPPSNNRGELLGALEGLRAANKKLEETACSQPVVLLSDSAYTIGCLSKWGPAWVAGGPRELADKKNLDLILPALDEIRKFQRLTFRHIRSHKKAPAKYSGEYFEWLLNDLVDRACQAALTAAPSKA